MDDSEVTIANWSDAESGSPTVEAVRRRYPSRDRFRVSAYRYPPSTAFSGVAKRRLCYVVRGAWRYSRGEATWILSAGQVAELPSGEFRLEVVGDEELVMVLVWDLSSLRPTNR